MPPDGDKKKTVTIMIFGGAKETEIAQKMIEEAIANKEQKVHGIRLNACGEGAGWDDAVKSMRVTYR